MASTYLEIVNDAIAESGADLAQYSSDGSDFTTQTDPLMNRFKVWVDRAWREIQRRAYDWQFLNNQGVVTIQPGLMFYLDGTIPGAITPTVDVYGTDDAIVYPNLAITKVVDLTDSTYSQVAGKSFGYVDLDTTSNLDMSFKAGGDYFYLEDRRYLVSRVGSNLAQLYQQGVNVGDSLSFLVVTNPGFAPSEWFILNDGATLTTVDPDVDTTSRGTSGWEFTTSSQDIIDAIDSGTYDIYIYGFNISLPTDWTFLDGVPTNSCLQVSSDDGGTFGYAAVDSPAYLHSWKSFDFSEETAEDDYQGEIRKINTATFRIIDHESPSPSTTRKLIYYPWDVFSNGYNNLNVPPSFPQYITQDNTGRWRLYPHPYQPVTLAFNFDRIPQKLELYSDIPKGIPEDFTELIMWLAVRYYGEYDEQPSVARRAERYFKDLLQRLEIIYRPKFRFKSGFDFSRRYA